MLLTKSIRRFESNIIIAFFVSVFTLIFLFTTVSLYLKIGEVGSIASMARIITYLLAVICIYIGFYSGIFNRYVTREVLWLWALYLYYLFVIYWDLYAQYDSGVSISVDEKANIINRMIRLVLLPMLACITFRRESLKPLLIAKLIYWITFLALMGSLSILNLTVGEVVEERVGVDETLNSLNLGYWGTTFTILTVFLLFKTENLRDKLIFFSTGIPLGLYVITISGSRGPIIFAVIVLYFYMLVGGVFKKYRVYLNVFLALVILLFLSDYTIVTDIIKEFNPLMADRLISSIEDQEVSGRNIFYLTGFEQFVENPFFGDYFVLTSGYLKGHYVHNILLESLMTMGLVGSIPFFILLYRTFLKTILMLRMNSDSAWIALFFLVSFFKGMSTWNLYGNMMLWVSMTVILTYKKRELQNTTL